MIYISHRGNILGVNPDRENTPEYIEEAIREGFDVEIDIWYVDNQFWLGHDSPEIKISEKYLENDRLWCHAKNRSALEKMLANEKIHCFWHQDDDFQLTSRNYIWTYPNKAYSSKSICVLPEKPEEIEGAAGLCLDDFTGLLQNRP